MSHPYAINHLMIVDTETGGLSPETTSIIEVAAQLHVVLVVEDTSQLARSARRLSHRTHGLGKRFALRAAGPMFHRLVKPRLPVEPQAAAVNGYDPERWEREGVESAVAMRDFLGFLLTSTGLATCEQVEEAAVDENYAGMPQGVIWTGSNVLGFDLPFLRSEMAAHGMSLPDKPRFARRTLNTESLCFPLFARGYTDSCGIASLRAWAGLEGAQKHRAVDDVVDASIIIRRYLSFIDDAFQTCEAGLTQNDIRSAIFGAPSAVQKALDALRILDIARSAGVELKEIGPGEYLGRVPWRDDQNPSLHVYSKEGKWIDFGTNESGSVSDFIARLGSAS